MRYFLFIIFLLTISCSIDTKSGIWNKKINKMNVGITVETGRKFKSEVDLVNKFSKISNNEKSCYVADIFKKDKPYLIAEIGINHNGNWT